MSEFIKNTLNEYCFAGEEYLVTDTDDLVKFTSNFITVKYEASPKSSQTMIQKTILLNCETDNKIEIKPSNIQVIFKKDGSVNKSPPNTINAFTIIESIEGVSFTHLIHVQDGNAVLYDIRGITNKVEDVKEEIVIEEEPSKPTPFTTEEKPIPENTNTINPFAEKKPPVKQNKPNKKPPNNKKPKTK